MKKTILVLLLLFEFASFCEGQNLALELLSFKPLKAESFIGIDGLKNMYFINNNILNKKSASESWQYKNISLGKITSVDIQNPLKIVLFYENFNTIVLLDNQLNEIKNINFSENNVPIIVGATGIAAQNKLWIYNSLSQQIGLFDYFKNTYRFITPSFQGNIKQYQSDFNTFYWIDEAKSGFSCDIFGKITDLGKIPDYDQIQVMSNISVLYKKNDLLYYYSLLDNKTYSIDFDKKTFDYFYYKDKILSIFTSEGITNYKITIP